MCRLDAKRVNLLLRFYAVNDALTELKHSVRIKIVFDV